MTIPNRPTNITFLATERPPTATTQGEITEIPRSASLRALTEGLQQEAPNADAQLSSPTHLEMLSSDLESFVKDYKPQFWEEGESIRKTAGCPHIGDEDAQAFKEAFTAGNLRETLATHRNGAFSVSYLTEAIIAYFEAGNHAPEKLAAKYIHEE